MKKLYLVDVSSMFFRAFFAIPPLNNKKGLPTNALYGFLSMTIKLLRDIRPDYLVYCFDRKEKSFRFDIYENYKAHREEMPEALIPQVPYVRQLTELLGIPALDQVGLEADDVIGTLARQGREHQMEVVIVSGDKDFAQLIDGFTSMYDTMKDVRYDVQGVVDKWGVRPDQMIDYLSLVGDSSDNIPGVTGIGPKGAQKLLAQFGSLDEIFSHIDQVGTAGLKKKLVEGESSARLSKRLVAIKCDANLGVEVEDLKLKPIDRDGLKAVLEELEFNSFERVLLQGGNGATANSFEKAPSKTKTTVDTTGTEPTPPKAEPAGGGIEEVDWTVSEVEAEIQPYSDVWLLDAERGFMLGYKNKAISVLGGALELGMVLEKKQLNWSGFDLKEYWKILDLRRPPVPAWDALLAAYVVRPGDIKGFRETYTKFTGRQFPDLASSGRLYMCHQELASEARERLRLAHGESVYSELELPLVPVLYQMERHGVLIDTEVLAQQSKTLATDIARLEGEIHTLAGGHFNVASPKQLAEMLFEKLKLPVGKKTKTGYSTDSEVLEKLAQEHPIAGKVIEFRELSKLKSTYVDALPLLVNQETGRVHTHFRQAATTTGRLSSVNPNLQNIPIRTERGRLIRQAFKAPEGKVLISADYSQIELRVLAHISGDEGLTSAFNADLDIHSATASEIFSVAVSEVSDDLRRTAKAVNFGIAYGQGAFGLAETLGISRTESKAIIDRYFTRFPGVKNYMVETVEKAKKQGFVETLFGRRRYLDELQSKNPALRAFGERAAINAPIQGTASDLVKKAMIALHQSVSIPMLLQVHDEIIFECDIEEVAEQESEIRQIMEAAAQLSVPLKVNIGNGPTWADC